MAKKINFNVKIVRGGIGYAANDSLNVYEGQNDEDVIRAKWGNDCVISDIKVLSIKATPTYWEGL